MRSTLVGPLLVWSTVFLHNQCAFADRNQALAQWESIRSTDFSAIPGMVKTFSPEQRQELIKAIKTVNDPLDTLQITPDVLVLLGDDETMTKLGQMVASGNDPRGNARSILEHYPSMKTIAALAPALADESDRGCLIASDVVELIRATPGFSDAVYHWASQFNYGIYYHWRLVMWEWWKANKIHFEKGDYLAVKPGALPPHNDEFTIEPALDGKENIRLLPPAAGWTPVAPADTPVPHSKSAAAAELQSREDLQTRVISRNYLVPALILLVLAVGLLAYITQRRKR